MWQDQRLLAAIAALPAEAFLEVAPEGAHLVGRRAARRARRAAGADAPSDPGRTPDAADDPDRLAAD
jgi:hypothetical protein